MEENGEDSHAMQTEENVEDLKESHDAEEDAELEDALKNGKGSEPNLKKRGRKKVHPGVQATPKKLENKEPLTPASDRPARERKLIDRFADSVEKEKEKPKEFRIEQGAGTYLKDIPNVVFKLSKRKSSDESVQLLHKLLYNKKVKLHQVKSNILQFSGCVWGPNEEKEKAKVKEKLEKCVKDNLCQLSDLLDLNILKSTRKEDVVLRVLEFLDCPHKTTEKLVQEEEQKSREKKRKKTPSKGKRKKSSGQTPRKRRKQEDNEDLEQGVDEDEENEDAQEDPEEEPEEEPEEVPVKKKKAIKIKDPSRDAKSSSTKKQGKKSAKKLSESEDIEEEPEEPVLEPEEPDEAPEEPKRKRSKNKKYEDDVVSKTPKKGGQKLDDVAKSPKKVVQKSVKKKSVYEPGEEDLDDEVKDVKSKPLSKVSKKPPPKEVQTPVVSPSKEKKKAGTGSTKVSSKKKNKEDEEEAAPPQKVPKKVRGASNSDAKEEIKSNSIPPDEDLRAAICELLHDADFSTVTFTDVVKQLGAKFDVDLSQNKAHVKNLIQEEISKIVDEDDGEGDNDEEAGIHTPEKKEKESAAED